MDPGFVKRGGAPKQELTKLCHLWEQAVSEKDVPTQNSRKNVICYAIHTIWCIIFAWGIPYSLVGSYLNLAWPSRAEEGFRMDFDTLMHLEKIEVPCPSRKCQGSLKERPKSNMAASGHFRFWWTWLIFINASKYLNLLSNLPLLSVVTGAPNMTLLVSYLCKK